MMRACVALSALLTLSAPIRQMPAAALNPDLRGAWDAELYELASGERYPVKGLIVFTASDWSVTFFVVPDGGTPVRAAAEGGTFTLDGTTLALAHDYRFSAGAELPGLPESPMRMEVDRVEAPLTPIVVSVVIERLELEFPSGNTMTFRRSSRF